MELQKLFVTLALEADEYKRGLQDAAGQAQGFASRIGGGLRQFGTIATGAFLGVGAAAVGGFGLAMHTAIGMNASLEQSTMQFTTLMGDADLAREHVAMLFELGAKTPFETGPIIAASKHLQVFGGAALNTQENLILIGDAAAAVGAPFDEVAFWTGRMYSAIQGGQPFGEAAMRLQELGLLTPEVRARMEELQKSGADAGVVWGEMQGQLGEFTGAMELQAGSWAGITSTLSDTLQMMAANALKPFFDLAKQGISAFTELLNDPAIQAGIAALAEKLTVIIQAVADFITGLVSGRDAATVFGELAFKLAEAFGATRQQAVEVYIAVKNFINQVMEFLAPIADAVTQFVSWKDVLIALGGVILATVIPAIIGIIAAMAPIILTATAVIGAVALIRNAWENNWGGIQEKTQAVIDFIVPLIRNAVEFIREWWEENGARIVAQAKADLEALRDAFLAAVDFIKNLVSTFLENLRAFWEKHGAGIVETVTKMWDLIKGLFEGVTKQLNLIGEAFRLAFAGEWELLGEKLFEIWETAWTTVVNFLSGLWDMVLPWLVSLWNSIKAWFTETDWKQLGLDVINGIVNGLRSAGQAIIDVIMGFMQAAWDRITQFWDMRSPSRLMDWAGQMVINGFVGGILKAIQSTRPELMTGLEGLVHDIEGALGMAASFGGIAGGFERRFQSAVLSPMEAQLENMDTTIGRAAELFDREFGQFGWEFVDWRDPMQVNTAMQQLQQLQERLWWQGDFTDFNDVRAALGLLDDRNNLNQEYIRQQERLLALEQARADMEFLKSQLDLLKLIQENAGILPANLLSGIQLGLAADPGQLMDIMSAVMQALVNSASQELNLNSQPERSVTLPGETRSGGYSVNSQTINGGQHNYFYGTEESELERLTSLGR